jgi:hypothetical protein
LEEFKDKWKYKVKKMQKLLVFKYELIVWIWKKRCAV